MKLELQEIISACGGRLLNGVPLAKSITGISTDTRKIEAGALFIPLKGDYFDGHDYIAQAAENGAICVLTERQNTPTDMDIPLIYVSSTRRALMDIADHCRRMHKIKVIAITGSAGKTTTKDMIADILSQKYKTKRTIKNFNNDIGMPLSVFQLEHDDEALVLEMGMNHAGEIRELSLVGAPDIAVITHIGDAHIENFENREGILRAKLEITDGLRTGGTIILNGDDPLLTGKIAAEKISRFNALFPSSENIIKAEPLGFMETRCHFHWRGKDIRITVPVPGMHMVMNALLACVAAVELGVSPEQIAAAFEKFTPPEGRLNVLKINGMTVINDVYNANPASMREAIKILSHTAARRVAVLGDIFELGNTAEARHREIGEFAAEAGVSQLIAIGTMAKWIFDEYTNIAQDRRAIYYKTLAEFLLDWQSVLQPNDVVLIKASNSMDFSKIVCLLAQ
jgi:UDP-N-acetylmuramoyl-tripeptide--D-alanyl-D-alanine ligase